MASNKSQDIADTTLQRRARRRLIGSIALVLVVVIALPMVFDEEKKPLDQDMSVQIPGQDAVTVRPPIVPGAKPKTVEPREPKSATSADASKAEPAPSTVTEAKGAPPPEAKPEPKAESRTDQATKQAKAEPTAAPRAEEARAKAILENKPSAAKEVDGFAVQIGAFASREKIREAREKLGAAGYQSYTEKLDTKDGERTRVRAGPFAGRDSAEAARDKIRALGFAGATVVPQ